MPTDTELLDWLQEQLDKAKYTGRVMYRLTSDYGIWLSETLLPGGVFSVREAIDIAMKKDKKSSSK